MNGSGILHPAPPTVSIQSVVNSIRNPLKSLHEPNRSKIKLSTAQQFDEWHWKTLLPRLNDEELFHNLAHSGSTNWWTTCTTLAYKSWSIAPDKWIAATRCRLRIYVIPAEQNSSALIATVNLWHQRQPRSDVWIRTFPHRRNSLRDLPAKAI